MSVKITNRFPSWSTQTKARLEIGMSEAVRDIIIQAKRKSPFEKGQLRANTDIMQLRPLHRRVGFHMEYARFQEFGGDLRRRVRNYTTAGTGPHYLRDSGNEIAAKFIMLLRKYT